MNHADSARDGDTVHLPRHQANNSVEGSEGSLLAASFDGLVCVGFRSFFVQCEVYGVDTIYRDSGREYGMTPVESRRGEAFQSPHGR